MSLFRSVFEPPDMYRRLYLGNRTFHVAAPKFPGEVMDHVANDLRQTGRAYDTFVAVSVKIVYQ